MTIDNILETLNTLSRTYKNETIDFVEVVEEFKSVIQNNKSSTS